MFGKPHSEPVFKANRKEGQSRFYKRDMSNPKDIKGGQAQDVKCTPEEKA